MDFKASEEELRILTDTYHEEIRETASNIMLIRYINSDMLWDSNWDSLFNEPVFQMLFYDADDDIEDTDQFMICRDIKGFAREDIAEDEMVRMYGMTEKETTNLFDLYITDFLKSADLASPLQIKESMDYNKKIIDIMFEVGYDKRYDENELLAIYELTDDERFLSDEAKDIFIF